MKALMQGGLHLGQVSLPVGQLAGACPTQFMNHHGDQWLIVTLGASRDELQERIQQILNAARTGVEARRVGEAVLVQVRGAEALIKSLAGHDELYLVAGSWAGNAESLPSFLPDIHTFESGAPEEFVQIFQNLEAKRFFADGLGTNFCVRSMEEASDIEQAERTLGARWGG